MKEGETLTDIETRYHVDLSQLLAANPSITNPDKIVQGQMINIPISESSAEISKLEHPYQYDQSCRLRPDQIELPYVQC